LDRICREEARADDIRRMVESTGRPLRSSAEHLSDEELLEKLRGFGVDLDRAGLEKLCEGALSAEEVARPLQGRRGIGRDGQADWIWVCLVSLWERWWPDKVCLEVLDDKVQAGYAAAERSETSRCAAIWLDAWSDVLRLCDAAGIGSVEEFDDRFPMTQSLYNWSQDLEDALWNAPGLGMGLDRLGGLLRAADRQDGDYGRAEELLRRGYSAARVRDRDCIAERLRDLCEETGRPREAAEFGRQARRLRARASSVTVSRRLDLADDDDGPVALRETTTIDFACLRVPISARLEAASEGCSLRSGYACQQAACTAGRAHRHPDLARRAGPRRRHFRDCERADALASGQQHVPR